MVVPVLFELLADHLLEIGLHQRGQLEGHREVLHNHLRVVVGVQPDGSNLAASHVHVDDHKRRLLADSAAL